LLLISSLQQTSALLAISAIMGSMREDTDCKTVQLSAQCMQQLNVCMMCEQAV